VDERSSPGQPVEPIDARRLFDASYRRLVVQMYGVCGDLTEAEDAVSEAFVRALAKPRALGRVAKPEAELSPDHVALVTALQQLSEHQRVAIALHHLGDVPVNEVAQTLGVPVGTVKARLSRGRAALAALLSDPNESTEAPHA